MNYKGDKVGSIIALSTTIPTKTGYQFDGWYTAETGGTKVGTAGASYTTIGNTTLYAHWNIAKYTVTYNANGGNGSMPTDTVTYNSSYTTRGNQFTREGYTFVGCNEKDDGTGVSWTSYIGKPWTWTYTKNVTLYAQWKFVVAPEFDTKIVNVTDTSFDVVVYNIVVPTGINDVQIQAYSAQNGEDDNKWVHATAQTDGSYKIHVDRTTWKNGGLADSGKWWVRAWVKDNNGKETYGGWYETTLKGWGSWIPGKWQTIWNNGYYEIQVFWSYRQDVYANQTQVCLEKLSNGSLTNYNSYYNNEGTAQLGIAGVGDIYNYTTASPNMTVSPNSWYTWDNPDIYTTVTHNADGSWPNPAGQFMWKANIGQADTPEVGWSNFYISIPNISK